MIENRAMDAVEEGDELIPTRASLLSRLKDWEDNDSWKVFFDTYWKLIYNAAIRSGLNEVEAQDVVQDTVISVFRNMPDFHYGAVKGSFKTWLLNLVSWRITDQFRKRQKNIEMALPLVGWGAEQPLQQYMSRAVESAWETIWDREWERNLTDAAIQRVKRAVDPKHYQIFHLYVIKNWPARQVASTLGVGIGRVYMSKHRIGTLIKNEIQRLRDKPL